MPEIRSRDARQLARYFDGKLGWRQRAQLFARLQDDPALHQRFQRELRAERLLVEQLCGSALLGADGSSPLELERDFRLLQDARSGRSPRRPGWLHGIWVLAACTAALLLWWRPLDRPDYSIKGEEPHSLVAIGAFTFEAGCRPAEDPQAALARRCRPDQRLFIRLRTAQPSQGHAAALVVAGERVIPLPSRLLGASGAGVVELDGAGVALAGLKPGMLTVHVMLSPKPIPPEVHGAVLRGEPLPEGLRAEWTRLVLAEPGTP